MMPLRFVLKLGGLTKNVLSTWYFSTQVINGNQAVPNKSLQHIYKLMKSDSYKRFIQSTMFKDIVADLKVKL